MAWRRGNGCSRCSTRCRRSPIEHVPASPITTIQRRDRVSSPDVPLRRHRGAPRCLADDSRRHDDGDRRRHWIGQVDAAQPAASPHDAPPGTVFIDGVDVREIPLATLRGAIGFVAQEPFLFSASVADNIAFGLRDRCDSHARDRRRRRDRAAGQGHRRRSRTATTRWWASAGSRCPVGRSSGRRSRARWSSTGDPGARRRVVGRRHLHRRGDSAAAVARHAPAHVNHRVAPRLDGARRRSDRRARTWPGRRVRYARRRSCATAACTPSSIGSSCSRRSWRRRDARRRRPRKGVRRPADAPAARLPAAIPAQVVDRGRRDHRSLLSRAGAAVPDEDRRSTATFRRAICPASE